MQSMSDLLRYGGIRLGKNVILRIINKMSAIPNGHRQNGENKENSIDRTKGHGCPCSDNRWENCRLELFMFQTNHSWQWTS